MKTLNQIWRQLLILPLAILLSATVSAAEHENFTMERFEALQQQGAPILVDIYASWCPDCQKQQIVLAEYQQSYPDSGLHILRVDFDTQKEWVTYFRAPRQAALILFSGGERSWFSVAETRRDVIFEALNAVAKP